MIILIGESGCGKSTVERKMCEKHGFERALSCTTRAMREGETEGVDYNYVSVEKFMQMRESGELLEFVEFNGNYYGLHKDNVRNEVIAVVEPAGMRQLKALDGIDAFSFYLRVPEWLREKRMLSRGDKPEDVQKRLENDREHFKGLDTKVDYIIDINEDTTVDDIIERILETFEKREKIGSILENGLSEPHEKIEPKHIETVSDAKDFMVSAKEAGSKVLEGATEVGKGAVAFGLLSLREFLIMIPIMLITLIAFTMCSSEDKVIEYSFTQDYAQPSGLIYPQEMSDIESASKIEFTIRDEATGGIPARGYHLDAGYYYFECENGATIFEQSEKKPSQWDYSYQIIGNTAIKIVDSDSLQIEELPDNIIHLEKAAIIQTTGKTNIIFCEDRIRLESRLTALFATGGVASEEELNRVNEESEQAEDEITADPNETVQETEVEGVLENQELEERTQDLQRVQ